MPKVWPAHDEVQVLENAFGISGICLHLVLVVLMQVYFLSLHFPINFKNVMCFRSTEQSHGAGDGDRGSYRGYCLYSSHCRLPHVPPEESPLRPRILYMPALPVLLKHVPLFFICSLWSYRIPSVQQIKDTVTSLLSVLLTATL